ncbi:hypothetical protein [Desulforamulus hydrothermalis]|uniref:Uncharacterized protein n=1 Tax=Desulforamulus hydrothermalis Lam5 = DSM 18033 TaxID=1121428 RepID=K8EHV5_9FIRM|nr:hypothetical protein [Desulforamulus hydrothermalis]CCO08216.1 conserved hypothetical protein [Desulforamulus hydrothermalis Lam5 = DSM 18033]SHH22257.1 hypothetical protein SAMN02745177_01865 [Desulforamulus hydrothermalis Lam5 = DSM 18033]
MTERGKATGKVIPFTPREKPKLKKLPYTDPAIKQLRREREKQQQEMLVRSKVVKNVGIFICLCLVVYLIKTFS